jgi:hypothetical protein
MGRNAFSSAVVQILQSELMFNDMHRSSIRPDADCPERDATQLRNI